MPGFNSGWTKVQGMWLRGGVDTEAPPSESESHESENWWILMEKELYSRIFGGYSRSYCVQFDSDMGKPKMIVCGEFKVTFTILS